MEGPCPTCNIQIRAPRSEDVHPIYMEPPGFAARKKIEVSPEQAEVEVEADQVVEERRQQRLEAEWRKSAEEMHSQGKRAGRFQRFLDSAWPQAGAITLFVASLVIAWRVLKS